MQFEKIQSLFFFGFLGTSTILFFWLIGGFIYTIFWAIFFSIVLYPLYKKILKKTKGRERWSSALTLIILLSIIIAPLSFTSYVIVQEIPTIKKTILNKEYVNNFLNRIPFKEKLDSVLISNHLDPENIENSFITSAKESLDSFGSKILSLGKNIFVLLMNFAIMLYLIYFGLKDGKKYLLRLSKILPLGDKTERRLFQKFSSIVRSIFKGTLIVSLIQGSLAGILFYIVGIEGVLIWTILLILAAMIPAVGVGLILLPTAIFMFLMGDIWEPVVLLLGTTIISTIDNILRPYLIGHETEMPDLIVTISILSGLLLFGATGLVIGPVIAGLFITMWHLFEEKYNDRLDNNE